MDSYEGVVYTLFIFVAVVTHSKKEQNNIHEVQKGGKQKVNKKDSVSFKKSERHSRETKNLKA